MDEHFKNLLVNIDILNQDSLRECVAYIHNNLDPITYFNILIDACRHYSLSPNLRFDNDKHYIRSGFSFHNLSVWSKENKQHTDFFYNGNDDKSEARKLEHYSYEHTFPDVLLYLKNELFMARHDNRNQIKFSRVVRKLYNGSDKDSEFLWCVKNYANVNFHDEEGKGLILLADYLKSGKVTIDTVNNILGTLVYFEWNGDYLYDTKLDIPSRSGIYLNKPYFIPEIDENKNINIATNPTAWYVKVMKGVLHYLNAYYTVQWNSMYKSTIPNPKKYVVVGNIISNAMNLISTTITNRDRTALFKEILSPCNTTIKLNEWTKCVEKVYKDLSVDDMNNIYNVNNCQKYEYKYKQNSLYKLIYNKEYKSETTESYKITDDIKLHPSSCSNSKYDLNQTCESILYRGLSSYKYNKYIDPVYVFKNGLTSQFMTALKLRPSSTIFHKKYGELDNCDNILHTKIHTKKTSYDNPNMGICGTFDYNVALSYATPTQGYISPDISLLDTKFTYIYHYKFTYDKAYHDLVDVTPVKTVNWVDPKLIIGVDDLITNKFILNPNYSYDNKCDVYANKEGCMVYDNIPSNRD